MIGIIYTFFCAIGNLLLLGVISYFGLWIGFGGTGTEPYIEIIWWSIMGIVLLCSIGYMIYIWKTDKD